MLIGLIVGVVTGSALYGVLASYLADWDASAKKKANAAEWERRERILHPEEFRKKDEMERTARADAAYWRAKKISKGMLAIPMFIVFIGLGGLTVAKIAGMMQHANSNLVFGLEYFLLAASLIVIWAIGWFGYCWLANKADID